MLKDNVVSLAAVACTFTLIACGSSAKPTAIPKVPGQSFSSAVAPSSKAAATPGPSITATLPLPAASPSRFHEAYANAFEDFWVAYAQADTAGNPDSAQLTATATGAALVWARKQVSDHVKLGVRHHGRAGFRSVGADHVTAHSALIGQCMDWSTWPVVNRSTGVVFQQFAVYSQLVDSKMVLSRGRWLVATVRVRDVPC